MDPLEDQWSLYSSYALNDYFNVKIHKNGIIVVFLNEDGPIEGIKFCDAIKQSLSELIGRGKRGAATITEEERFAMVVIGDEERQINSPIRAKLIELNLDLETKIEKGAYVCIYQPRQEEVQQIKCLLERRGNLSQEEQALWDKYFE